MIDCKSFHNHMDFELFVLFAKVYIIFDIANYNNIVHLFCYFNTIEVSQLFLRGYLVIRQSKGI